MLRHVFTAVLATAITTPTLAGPLTPPGAPSSTYKTLTEVEPRTAINSTNTPGNALATYVIANPGSYYLIDNITGEINKNGILVTSPNVMIDLNGFTMLGVVDSLDAITASPVTTEMISVRNGQIREWDEGGITLPGADSLVSDVVLRDIRFTGVSLGDRGIISNCVIDVAGSSGISAGINSLVSDCSVTDIAAFDGIFAGNGSIVRNCTVTNAGRNGFSSGDNVTIENCFSELNDEDGFSVANGCTIEGSKSSANGLFGVVVLEDARLEGNTVLNNGSGGMQINNRSTIIGNTVSNNGFTIGGGPGISVLGDGGTIERNYLQANDGFGIILTGGANLYLRNRLGGNNGGAAQFIDLGAGNRDGGLIDVVLSNILY